MFNPKSQQPPNETDLLDQHKRDVQLSINCHQIGIIDQFDASTQLATVKIAMKQVTSIDLAGNKEFTEYPLIFECPVVTLFGGVSFLSMPIQPGDSCLLCFNDRNIENWLNSGNGSYPNTPLVHDMTDCIAIVGIRHLGNSIANYLAEGIRLSYAPDSQIDLKANLIESIASLFLHNGDMEVTGDLQVGGNMTILGDTYGNGDEDINLRANLRQNAPYRLEAGNGATGTFNVVQVVKGIVVSGS